MRTKIPLIAGALLLMGSIAWAQDKAPAAPDRHGMMQGDKGGMMGRGMMGMMGGDPAQMSRMMENCNRMMESWLQDHPSAPGTPSQPAPKG
jgi:periplasmic protein CpxP/Spy